MHRRTVASLASFDLGKRDVIEQGEILVEHLACHEDNALGMRRAHCRNQIASGNEAGHIDVSAEELVFDRQYLELAGKG